MFRNTCCVVCLQEKHTFQLVLTTDGQRHAMILHYGRLEHGGTVNSCDLCVIHCHAIVPLFVFKKAVTKSDATLSVLG